MVIKRQQQKTRGRADMPHPVVIKEEPCPTWPGRGKQGLEMFQRLQFALRSASGGGLQNPRPQGNYQEHVFVGHAQQV